MKRYYGFQFIPLRFNCGKTNETTEVNVRIKITESKNKKYSRPYHVKRIILLSHFCNSNEFVASFRFVSSFFFFFCTFEHSLCWRCPLTCVFIRFDEFILRHMKRTTPSIPRTFKSATTKSKIKNSKMCLKLSKKEKSFKLKIKRMRSWQKPKNNKTHT